MEGEVKHTYTQTILEVESSKDKSVVRKLLLLKSRIETSKYVQFNAKATQRSFQLKSMPSCGV